MLPSLVPEPLIFAFNSLYEIHAVSDAVGLVVPVPTFNSLYEIHGGDAGWRERWKL